MEGLIAGKHCPKKEEEQKGPVDSMVDEAIAKANAEHPPKEVVVKT